jgi:hypothetical protein
MSQNEWLLLLLLLLLLLVLINYLFYHLLFIDSERPRMRIAILQVILQETIHMMTNRS